MSKPNIDTPVAVLVLMANSVVRWRLDHDGVLTHYDESDAEQGRALGDALKDADAAFTREQRESVAATYTHDQAILSARQVVKAVEAGAERAFKLHSTKPFELVRRDFIAMRASHIRTAPSALKALKVAGVGVDAHKDTLDKGKLKRSARLLAQIQSAEQTVLSANDDTVRESQESQSALRQRDEARAQVLNYIDDALLMAQEAAADNSGPLLELNSIFDKLLPSSPSSSPKADDASAPAPDTTA
jgi:hypothetical protein